MTTSTTTSQTRNGADINSERGLMILLTVIVALSVVGVFLVGG